MIKYRHWLPKLLTKLIPGMTVNAIVIFGNIYFLKRKSMVSKKLFRHELVHVEQQEREGVLFYIRYICEYLKNLIKYKNHTRAYLNISYEIEARKAEK